MMFRLFDALNNEGAKVGILKVHIKQKPLANMARGFCFMFSAQIA
jgi:hypothetical protein